MVWPEREEESVHLAGTGRTNAQEGAITQNESSTTGANACGMPCAPPIIAVRTEFSQVMLLS